MQEFSRLSIFIVSCKKNQAMANPFNLAREYIGSTTQEPAVTRVRSDGLQAEGINTVQSSKGSTGHYDEEWGRTRKFIVTAEQVQIFEDFLVEMTWESIDFEVLTQFQF